MKRLEDKINVINYIINQEIVHEVFEELKERKKRKENNTIIFNMEKKTLKRDKKYLTVK